MGCFRVDVKFLPPADRSRSAIVPQMLVDADSNATWVPSAILEQLGIPHGKHQSFRMVDGQEVRRSGGQPKDRLCDS